MAATQVKALVDLYDNIRGKITDTYTRELLLPLREMIQDVRESQFEMEQKHREEMLKLKEGHQKEIQQLNERISEIARAATAMPQVEFSKDTGTWIGADEVHYCPRCWSDKKPSPMTVVTGGWICGVCNKGCNDPKRPMSRPTMQQLAAGSRTVPLHRP